MRRAFTLLVLVPLSLASLACTPQVSSELSLPVEPAVASPELETIPNANGQFDVVRALDGAERILAVIDATADNPERAVQDDYDMQSWLTDVGLRSLYYYYGRAELSLAVLADLFATPLYRSGPHEREPQLSSSEFGHYEPLFVARVTETAEALGRDRARVERTRPAFERRLRRQALTYLLVHRAIHHDAGWYTQFEHEYVAVIGTPDSTFVRYDDLSVMDQAFEDAGYSLYEADTAAYFWVRRERDGSASAWLRAIEALLAAYGVEVPSDPPGLPARARP